MNVIELKNELDNYNNCITSHFWTMSKSILQYENDYIEVVRIDSSNHWVGNHEMEKMWSIIVKIKRPFSNLQTYRQLYQNVDIAITSVTHGKNKGCYGIRLYGMKREPDEKIIRTILDYIFS